MSEKLVVRIVVAIAALLAFAVMYWWRRRTRAEGLELSVGARRLTEMVKTSDAPDSETVEDIIADAVVKGSKDL